MLLRYTLTLIFALAVTLVAQEQERAEPTMPFWNGHAQYLFFQANINFPDSGGGIEWERDIDREESSIGIVYYLQLYRFVYLRGAYGQTDYTYTERYRSTREIIERRDADFDYLQGGLALAFVETPDALATVDLEYMHPLGGSASKEVEGVVTPLDDPEAKVVASVNAHYCFKHLCLGGGLSTEQYRSGLNLYLRMGARF
ncbi:hypothetical protein ACXWTF_07860 [Thiomicrolovo sp. ZZH C-3]